MTALVLYDSITQKNYNLIYSDGSVDNIPNSSGYLIKIIEVNTDYLKVELLNAELKNIAVKYINIKGFDRSDIRKYTTKIKKYQFRVYIDSGDNENLPNIKGNGDVAVLIKSNGVFVDIKSDIFNAHLKQYGENYFISNLNLVDTITLLKSIEGFIENNNIVE